MPLEDLPNIGRAMIFVEENKVDLLINVKPFSCMPGNVVEAIMQRIQKDYDIPVISLSYEGRGDTNQPIETILSNL